MIRNSSPAGGKINVAGSLWVSKSGNDATGQRNRFDKHFLTYGAAKVIAEEGDTIFMFDGDYNEKNIAKHNISVIGVGNNVRFIYTGADDGAIIDDTDTGTDDAVTFTLKNISLIRYGTGNEGSLKGAIEITSVDSVINVTSKYLDSNTATVYADAGILNINLEGTLTGDENSTAAVYSSGAELTIVGVGKSLVTSKGSGIFYCDAGTLNLSNCDVYADAEGALANTNNFFVEVTAKVNIKNCLIECKDGFTNGLDVITISTTGTALTLVVVIENSTLFMRRVGALGTSCISKGSGTLSLLNVKLINFALPASGSSLKSLGAAQDVKIFSLYRNKPFNEDGGVFTNLIAGGIDIEDISITQ